MHRLRCTSDAGKHSQGKQTEAKDERREDGNEETDGREKEEQSWMAQEKLSCIKP